ncbi:MAG: outer membrane protein assembly factor BamA [Candidatus Omnitrophota bacterium]|nr:outer membrane protein assembly factor BamA [Candidatus Omnitrophota bacterium]
MRKLNICRLFFFTFVFAFFLSGFSLAQEEKISIIDVEIRGNKLISSSIIMGKIKTKSNDDFDQAILNQDIKRLYATGYFTDVKLELVDLKDGIKVVFVVIEKPRVAEIIIKGNKAIKTNELTKEMQTAIGNVLDGKLLKEDINQFKRLYKDKGFQLADISYKVELDDLTGEAAVHISIDEEKKVRIKRINIYGNLVFSDKRILQLMKTRSVGIFRSGFYKEEVFKEDVERIKAFYQQAGYGDIGIIPEIHYDIDKKRMYLTLNITEGKKYLAGQIEISGNELFPAEEIRECLKMCTGDTFSQYSLIQDIAVIQEFYFAQGYISAEITSHTTLDEITGAVNINYKIVENELAYIDKVKIRGNTKTKDIVIRRELKLIPGEKFDGEKLQRSKEKLYNLGYFEEVSYDVEPGSAPNKKDLAVMVKERKTGELSFGGGYSTIDQFVGFVQVSQRNFDLFNFPEFTGAGQYLSIRAEFGTERKSYSLSFTEPWLFNRPISFGFDVYSWTRDWADYNEERQGGDVRLGRSFGEYDRIDLIYKAENITISDISPTHTDIVDEEGTNLVSSTGITLTRDTRDNIYVPTRGMLIGGTGQCFGGVFGGDRDFYKMTGTASTYFSYFRKLVVELKARVGVAREYGNTHSVPIYERFYAGGANTVRGYEERMVGPPNDGSNPIGGKTMLIFNAECTFPIIEVIKGAIFYDIGNVWRNSYQFNLTELKSGVGLGVRVKTPIGPIKFDYGYGLNYEDWDQDQNGRLYFSITRGF